MLDVRGDREAPRPRTLRLDHLHDQALCGPQAQVTEGHPQNAAGRAFTRPLAILAPIGDCDQWTGGMLDRHALLVLGHRKPNGLELAVKALERITELSVRPVQGTGCCCD